MLSTSPGLLLISVFTPFTASCKTLNEQKYIFISKKWTVINFALSIVSYLCGSCFLTASSVAIAVLQVAVMLVVVVVVVVRT